MASGKKQWWAIEVRRPVIAAICCWGVMVSTPFGAVGQQQPGVAQVPSATPTATEGDEKDAKLIETLKTLQALVASLEADADTKREQIADPLLPPDKIETLVGEIADSNQQIKALRENYEEFASGIDLDNLRESSDAQIDLAEGMREFLSPIVSELKDLTARPREIEELRRNIVRELKNRDNAEKALSNVQRLLQQMEGVPDVEGVKIDLRDFELTWQQRYDQFESDIEVAQFQLDEKLKDTKSIWGTSRSLMASFFRSRGRNLLFALLAFATVLLLSRLAHKLLVKWSPLRKMERRSFSVRVLDIAYFAIAVALAVLAALVVLYSAADWVLLGVVLIFFAGLAWAGKHTLPQAYEQIKLMLNLGPVREGERLVYQGVPWRVERIALYTDLVNPSLEGGLVRLPIRTLSALHSRPFGSKETWFPSEQGNWVLLSDATFGRVIMQTPDWVELVLLGGSRKTYTASEFVAMNPENLSRNFRIRIEFGVDYSHQSISTTKIPRLLQDYITKGLLETTLLKEEELIHLAVDFCNAGASSLDYTILLDCQGSVAQNYNKLQRCIMRLCVDAANEHGWVIPFTQLTLHYADAPQASSEPIPMSDREK